MCLAVANKGMSLGHDDYNDDDDDEDDDDDDIVDMDWLITEEL